MAEITECALAKVDDRKWTCFVSRKCKTLGRVLSYPLDWTTVGILQPAFMSPAVISL